MNIIHKKIQFVGLLLLAQLSFGQLKIDSVKTDSINCDNAISGCVTLYISGINVSQPFNLTIQGTGVGGGIQTKTNQTTSPVTFCNVAPGDYLAVANSISSITFLPFRIDANLPLLISHEEDSVHCFGDTTGSIKLNVLNGKGPFDIDWSTGLKQKLLTTGSVVLPNLGVGTYSFIIADSASGCVKSDTIEYLPLDTITPSFTVDPQCPGLPITVTNTTFVSGGFATIYDWQFPGAIPNSATTPGPHQIFYTNGGLKTITMILKNPRCEISFDTTILIPSSPPIVASADQSICRGDTVQLNASGGVSYIWTPNTSILGINSPSPLVFPTNTTSYIVAGSDALGCVGRDTVVVTVNTIPNLLVSNDTTICNGGTANLSSTGATSYTWSPTIGLSDPNIPNPVATPTVTTSYVLTAIGANGCSQLDTVIVTVNQSSIVKPSNDTTICSRQSVTLNVSGANSYIWAPNIEINTNVGTSIVATPTVSRTYTVTGTSSQGCISSDSVNITVADLPNITISDSDTICAGQNITLNATGGTNYLWNNAATLSSNTISNPIANPTLTTTYTVSVSNGVCSKDTSTTITVFDPAIVTVSNDTSICRGSSANLLATGGNSYSWFPTLGLNNANIPNPIANPNVTTKYLVQVGINGLCFATDSVLISVNPVPNPVSSNDTTICNGSSVNLSTSGGTSYQWTPAAGLSNPNIPNPIATPLNTTAYIVRVNGVGGCFTRDTVNISVNPKITANVSSDKTSICEFDTINLVASGGISYEWKPTTQVLNPNSATTRAVPLVNTTYMAVVSGIGGFCKDSASVNISVTKAPKLIAGGDQTICSGDTVTLSASGATGYTWSPSTSIVNPNIANPRVFPQFSTQFIVRGDIGSPCPAVDSVFVQVFPRPNLDDFRDSVICLGQTVTYLFTEIGTYNWSPNIEISSINTNNPTFSPSVDRTYFLNFTDGNACTVLDTLSFDVKTLPVVNILGDTNICLNENINLSSSLTANIYNWTRNNISIGSNQTISGISASNNDKIKLDVIDIFGCRASDSTLMKIFNFPLLQFPNDTTICDGDTIKLSLDNSYNYSWSPTIQMLNPNSANPIFFPTFPRSYEATISDGVSACILKDTFDILTIAKPTATITSPDSACFKESITITGNGGLNQNWIINGVPFGGPTVIMSPISDLNILLTTIGAGNCKNTASKVIKIDDSVGVSLNAPINGCEDVSVAINSNTLNVNSLNWSTGQITLANQSINLILKKDTTVRVIGTSLSNCKDTTDVSISVIAKPVFNLTGKDSLCENESTSLTASGAFTFNWSPNPNLTNIVANTSDFTSTTSDTVFVSATAGNGCSATDSLIILVSPFPAKVLPPSTEACSLEKIVFNLPAGNTYTSSSPNSTKINATTFEVNAPSNQLFDITITNPFECATDDQSIIIINSLPVINLNNSIDICSNVIDTLKATSPSALTFLWSPATGLGNPNTGITSINPAGISKYFVTATDAKNCKKIDSILVNIVSAPIMGLTQDSTYCTGLDRILTATGATNYFWSPLPDLTNVSGNQATYVGEITSTVQVIGEINGCRDTVLSLQNLIPRPFGKIDIDDSTLCDEQTSKIDLSLLFEAGNGSGTFSLDNGVSFNNNSSININPTKDTTVQVVFRNSFGCVSLPKSQNIIQYKGLSVKIDTITYPQCTGVSGAFNVHSFAGGTPNYQYSFQGTPFVPLNVDTVKYTNLTPGNYLWTLKDTNLCIKDFTIQFLSTINFDSSVTNIKCNGETNGKIQIFNIKGGQLPYGFAIDQNTIFSNDSNFVNLSAGNYIVYIKDNSGCELQTPFKIIDPLKLDASIGFKNDILCDGKNDGSANIVVTGGTPIYTVSGFGKTIKTNNSALFSGLPIGKFPLTISDTNSCSDTLSVTIRSQSAFETTLAQTGFDCTSDSIDAQIVSTSGGSGDNVYSIDLGTSFISLADANNELKGINPGQLIVHTLDVINGCRDTSSILLTSLNGLDVDKVTINSLTPTCIGNNGTINITNLFNGPRPLKFQLYLPDFTDSLASKNLDSNLVNLTSGPKGIKIIDNAGCEYLFRDTIDPKIGLISTVEKTDLTCGDTITSAKIKVSGGFGNYQIGFSPSVTSTDSVFNSLKAGKYKIFYFDPVDNVNCLDSAEFDIFDKNAKLKMRIEDAKCYNAPTGSVILDSILNYDTSLYSYKAILDSGKRYVDSVQNNVAQGFHKMFIEQITLSDNDTCYYPSPVIVKNILIDSFLISNRDTIKAIVDVMPDGKELDFTGSFWVHSISGGTAPYLVSLSDTNNFRSYSSSDSLNTFYGNLQEGTYTAFIKDSLSCIHPITSSITSEFNTPNIFTPNGDGINDSFFIVNLPKVNLLRVYDRWGSLIYMHRNYDNSWDGNRQADGVYYYTLKTDVNVIKGWIQIVR